MDANNSKIGVMLMAFGGPDSLDSVESFMEKLMKGRKPTPEIVARAKEKYRLIGGKSPLPEITRRQAAALESKLKETCPEKGEFKTYVGMRYWHPFIEDTIKQMAADGIKRAFAISMSPHGSRVSTGAYAEEITRVVLEGGLDISVQVVGGMYNNPLFIEAVAEKIASALDRFPEDTRGKVQVIFSAHSLPVSYIEGGDPYVEEIKVTIDEVLKRLQASRGPLSWRIAYQSKGNIPGEWLGPMVEDVYQDIIREGFKDVLVVPIGFAADHVETLWDLDILHKKQAEDLGLRYERSEALNDSPKFMEALASMVCARL